MGLVINQSANMSYSQLFSQLKLNTDYDDSSPLIIGGPVQKELGFVLHSSDKDWTSTLQVSDDISLTGSIDILQDIAQYRGPENAIVTLGYAGWNAGQLEQEIVDHSWLTLPADKRIIFKTPVEERWTSAASHLGIDVNLLSSQAGHA